MIIPLAGCTGIGLAWGWLLGSLEGRITNPRVTIPAAVIATVIVSLPDYWYLGVAGTVTFLAGLALAMTVHVSWRRSLWARFGAVGGPS